MIRLLARRPPSGQWPVPSWCSAPVPSWCSAAAYGLVFGVALVYLPFSLMDADRPSLEILVGRGISGGEPPFPLQASGWLNGPPPSWKSLLGKVVVVDVWTEW